MTKTDVMTTPHSKSLQLGSMTLEWGRQTYVMGIINMTPDSFSGDGLYGQKEWLEQAIAQAKDFAQAGAHILDIGGESTRPDADLVDVQTEKERVLPVIKALVDEVDLPISIDTYKAEVAAAALDAGAVMVNDVWGLRMDPAMGPLCAERDVPVVMMHNRMPAKNADQALKIAGHAPGEAYDDLLTEVTEELRFSLKLAKMAGISENHIILDPGIGFGKNVVQNLQLINHLDHFKALGYPILLGPSNKSFIGHTLNLPEDDRVEGTAAAIAIGIARGADIIRVHQVKAMSRVARMTDALVRAEI